MAGTLFRKRINGTGGARPGGANNYTDFATTGLQTMAGSARISREVLVTPADLLVSASSFNSGSMAMATFSGSNLSALKMTNTVAGSPLWASFPIPQDQSITGGSGALFIDWLEAVTNSACAVFAASVYAWASGCSLGSASTLGAIAETQFAGASSTNLIQSNIMSVQSPVLRGGRIGIKFYNNMGSASQSASSLHIFNVRYRYVADRLGLQATGT